MRFGVFHVSPNSEADPAVVAKHAENLGFESYWVADHTILPMKCSVPYPGAAPDGSEPDYLWQIPDPLIALARATIGLPMTEYAASHTKEETNIRLGTRPAH